MFRERRTNFHYDSTNIRFVQEKMLKKFYLYVLAETPIDIFPSLCYLLVQT